MAKIEATAIQQWYKDCKDETEEWRTEARENYDLVAGWQWDKSEEQELKEKRRLPIVMNRIGPYIDAIIGYQINNRKEVRYLPRENSDSATAQLLSEAGRWADDLCDAEDEQTDAFGDMVICGMGWTETRMDYAVDPDGRLITAERIDPLEMFWDINASKRNLTDASYVIRARKMEHKQAETKWPILTTVTPTYADDEEVGQFPLDGSKTDYDETGRESRDGTKNKSYLILQCQWLKDEDIYRVADPVSGQIINLTRVKFDKLKETLDAQGIRYAKTQKRYYYQAFVTGDVILEEGQAPSQEGFTIKAICAKRDRNKHGWYGIVRGLKDPQKFSNKFFSDFLYILATNRKGGAFVESGALEDPRKAEEMWADPAALIKLNRGGLNMIRERDAAPMPTGLDRLMQYSINAIPETSGMNPEMIGMADRAQPGILEAQRKQAGLTVLAPLFDSLKRYMRERGRIVMDMIRRYISDGRLIRIVGQDGQTTHVPLILPDAATYDIIVDEASTTPNQKEQTLMVLAELTPLLAGAGVRFPPEIIEYLPLPTTLIEKWKQQLAPKQQAPDPRIQLEMMKNMNQMKQAEIRGQIEMVKLQREQQNAAEESRLDAEERALRGMEMQLKAAELRLRAAESHQTAITDALKIQAQNFENVTDVVKENAKLEGTRIKARATRKKQAA